MIAFRIDRKAAQRVGETAGSETRTPETERALAIRDHVLPLLRSGTAVVMGSTRFVTREAKPFLFAFRGPLANVLAEPQPYCLDVFHRGRKVMSLEWADDGSVRLVSFRPG
jgi:hypothetical protein